MSTIHTSRRFIAAKKMRSIFSVRVYRYSTMMPAQETRRRLLVSGWMVPILPPSRLIRPVVAARDVTPDGSLMATYARR